MQILCSGKISFGLPWRHVSHSHWKLQSQIQGTTTTKNQVTIRFSRRWFFYPAASINGAPFKSGQK